MKRIIASLKAPKAVGPYSQAIVENSKYRMELSGQIGVNPETGSLVPGGVVHELEQTMKNIAAILSEVGWRFENIVKVRIFLTEMADYKSVNEAYGKKFTGSFPARVALAVKALPLGAAIEIECMAAGDEIKK